VANRQYPPPEMVAHILALELGKPRQDREGVQGFPSDEQIVLRPRLVGVNLPDRTGIVEQPDLSNPVVRR
jgi:hypothetical protein